MATVLRDLEEIQCASAKFEQDDLWLKRDDFEMATGWELKPEGYCKGDLCIPANAPATVAFSKEARLNASGFWRHLGHPVVNDNEGEVWVFGASAQDRAASLQSSQAPDFSLPDLHGNTTTLSGLRGKKVLLATWASW